MLWGRLRQVAYYVRPRFEPADLAWVRACLSPDQARLFEAMSQQDKAHAVRVARRLAACDAPAYVLEAALLHDCGKPPGYGLFGRVLGVLLARWFEDLPPAPPLGGLRRHLQIYRWHDAYGLAAARAAGTTPEALALLDAYIDPQAQREGSQPWLGPMSQADDQG